MTHDDAKLQAFAFGTCPSIFPTHPTHTWASVHHTALHTHCAAAMRIYIYTTALCTAMDSLCWIAMLCIVLHCTVVDWTGLLHSALHCIELLLHHTALCWTVLDCYCITVHCIALTHTVGIIALYCTVLDCIALHCYCIGLLLHCTALHLQRWLLTCAVDNWLQILDTWWCKATL